ncbi:MAG: phosphoethanolamine--lipid A transferase EptA [Bacteroidaceae bacterium]|nr:phosphoethanolamine--lipid A transferase EptA [Bacteroidaceae bacterium]
MKLDFLKKPEGIQGTSIVLSIYTTLVFHVPAFKAVLENIESGWNGALIFTSVAVLMLVVNFFFYDLLLWLGRTVGKAIIAFTFIADAISLYFINTYEVLITDAMMGNVFNTRYSEASGFFSWVAILYVLFLGVPPCIYLFVKKTTFSTFKKFLANIGMSLLIILLVVIANMRNTLWIDNNSTQLGSLLMPWSYTVNTFRYYGKVKKRNQKEIQLPDAQFTNDSKDVVVLIIGESARRQNFSLYGYERNTNPLLAGDSVKAYIANSAATYTTAAVKAILDHKPTGKLYEILPNYLYRNGVDVVWRSYNWGQPPLHIKKYINYKGLAQKHPEAKKDYDELLLAGLQEEILSSDHNKQLIVLHCSTSHGPTYNKKYPAEFEKFTPACNTVEISTADRQELLNAYDNTILYTDYLVHSVIEVLKQIPDRRCCMMFVSDHGESLGEDNLFMHGMPKNVAPKEQFEIPFIVWQNDSNTEMKNLPEVEQYYVFHSVMNYLGMQSEIYNENMNIFVPTEK